MQQFKDRNQAGKVLAERLLQYKRHDNAIVLALPRGGVPVGYEIAKSLNLPLDVYLVRKLGVPGHEELAMGAITTESRILNNAVVQGFDISPTQIEAVARKELQELLRRELRYRAGKAPLYLHGKTVIVVDDGLATGATMRAAIVSIKAQHPAKIIVAVPVAPAGIEGMFAASVDEYIVLLEPETFYGVSKYYKDFHQVSDMQVSELLETTEVLREGV